MARPGNEVINLNDKDYERKSFKAAPAGTYTVRVSKKSVIKKFSSASGIALVATIIGGARGKEQKTPHKGINVFDNIVLGPKSGWKIAQLLNALGKKKLKLTLAELFKLLENKEFRVLLRTERFEGKNRNKVVTFLPITVGKDEEIEPEDEVEPTDPDDEDAPTDDDEDVANNPDDDDDGAEPIDDDEEADPVDDDDDAPADDDDDDAPTDDDDEPTDPDDEDAPADDDDAPAEEDEPEPETPRQKARRIAAEKLAAEEAEAEAKAKRARIAKRKAKEAADAKAAADAVAKAKARPAAKKTSTKR